MPAHIGFLDKAKLAALSFGASISQSKSGRGARAHIAYMVAMERGINAGPNIHGDGDAGNVNVAGFDAEPNWDDYIVSPKTFYEIAKAKTLVNRNVFKPDGGTHMGKIDHSKYMTARYSSYRQAIATFDPKKPATAHRTPVTQNEWDLYFAKDTAFNEEIETLFEFGYKLSLILSTDSKRLKRIEAVHETTKKPLIVWTAA